ncbi:NADH-ubiquinone oxidoreductase-F iron-sulfur binding region domain-containing protein [Microbacterium sp. NPDC076911]|uniref:NADH-ubiquinone oxidoreductase-F iron-sulfur binding region domain-containing protein n=1 Tax=Microbacterium sp. NPDC076911 TaxID=3154958 RepID=UPI0034274E25
MTVSTAPDAQLEAVAPAGVSRLLAAPHPSYSSHVGTHGVLPQPNRATLLCELEASGLGGRGGAAFPTSRKLAAIDPDAAPPIVIGNGAEGEPLSVKDATLLTRAPHLVIDGLLLVAEALNASETYLAASARQLASVRTAIAERADAGKIIVHESADSFISGEASAIVNSVGGGRAIPTDRSLRLTERGLKGRPTLVQNVETLAHIALVARWGGAWYRTVGAADEPGSRLLSITARGRTRVVEATGGIEIARALEVAGVDAADTDAVLVGGYHGAWVPRAQLGTALSRAALAPFAAAPGAGILFALSREQCPLATAAEIANYLASQSARQCGPCANGLPRMAETLSTLAAGRADASTEIEVRRMAALVAGRGSCHHPDGTARFVLSTLETFSSEVARHLNGQCRLSVSR